MRRAHIPAAALLMPLAVRLFLPGPAEAQYSYKTGIDLVGFTVTVIDRSGKLLADLKPADFDIREDGVPQTLAYFSPGSDEADVPLHIGLLFDTSESMEQDLSFSRSAAIKFLSAFPRAVDFSVVDFDSEVRAARFSQSEFPRLVERIRNRRAKGFTALYDALSVYLGGAFDETGRKVLVVYTDGGDTSSSRSWSETVRLLKASDVTVYPIGFMAHQSGSSRFLQQGQLSEMAALTGGLAFFPSVMKELDAMYGRIADEMHAQYTLGYLSTNLAHDGKWRNVAIKVTRPGFTRLVIRTRQGYFAATK
jgi:Ca-activated chloride channel family protein